MWSTLWKLHTYMLFNSFESYDSSLSSTLFKAETAPIRHLVKSGSDLVWSVIVRPVHGFFAAPDSCIQPNPVFPEWDCIKKSSQGNQMVPCNGHSCCHFYVMRLLQGVAQSPEAFCEDQSWSEPGAHLRILPERARILSMSMVLLSILWRIPKRDWKQCHTRKSLQRHLQYQQSNWERWRISTTYDQDYHN